MSNLNLKTHPLKDSPKPSNRVPHPAHSWKPEFHKEIAVLPNRHRGDKFVIRENSLRYLIPLHDRVLVKRKASAVGLIMLTDAANSLDAEIIALGRKCKFGHQVGQLVRLSPSVNADYSDLMEDGDHYLIVQEADILGILTNDHKAGNRKRPRHRRAARRS